MNFRALKEDICPTSSIMVLVFSRSVDMAININSHEDSCDPNPSSPLLKTI